MDLIETPFANECQIGMKWRIKEADLKQEKCLRSQIFHANIPGVKYCLLLYPNGRNEVETNKVKVYLHLIFGIAKEIVADFSFSIKSASKKIKFENEIYKKSTGWGKTLCTREELFDAENKYFIDGIMEFELSGALKSKGIKRKASESLSLAQVLWEKKDEKDLTITADKHDFKIHKWVLCAKSPVFKAEMESGFKEAKENKINIIDFAVEIVQIFIEYCYERDITILIKEKNVSELLHFSDKYDIKSLHVLIQEYMIKNLQESNVCKFANASITGNAGVVRECCICFLLKLIGKAVIIDNYDRLDKEILEEIGRRSFLSTSD